MLERVKKYIKDGNCYTGVEYVERDSILNLYCTQLSKKRDELDVTAFFAINTITELSLKLKKDTSLFLVINTSQVLSKIIEKKETDDLTTINSAFPNIELDTFYYEITSFGENLMIAICRKEHVDDILSAFSEKKQQIIGFSLAFQQLYQVEKFIDQTVIKLPEAILNREDKRISINNANENNIEYNINGSIVKNTFLVSFSSALTHFLNGSSLASNFIEKTSYLKSEYYQKRFFQLYSKSFGITILGLLLINFFFFNHYFQKVEKLKETAEVNTSNKEKLLELSEIVLKKEKLIDDVVSSSSSKSSMYLDQIASLLPSTLLLSSMDYQPIESKIKKNETILFDVNSIHIKGQAKDNEDFSKWIEAVEKLDWVSRLDVTGYGYENKSTSSFIVLINIENE